MEHISVKNICKKYGEGESAVKALDDESLDIAKGEITSLGKKQLISWVYHRMNITTYVNSTE